MAYYRINASLTVKDKIIKGNTIFDLDISDDKIQKLLKVGVISELSIPPLAFIPNWEIRAEMISKSGITLGLDFLNSDSKEIASKTKKSIETINQWKLDLIDDLIVKHEKNCCGE